MKHYWWLIDKNRRVLKQGAEDNDNLIHTVMWLSPGVWQRLDIERMFYVPAYDGEFFFIQAPYEPCEPLPMRVKAAFDAAIDDYETHNSGRA